MKKRTLTIKVTKKHIKKGKPQRPASCPIALALLEQGFSSVRVDDDSLEFSEEIVSPRFGKVRIGYKADMPERGRKFVVSFDEREAVKPLTFIVRDIVPSNEDSVF